MLHTRRLLSPGRSHRWSDRCRDAGLNTGPGGKSLPAGQQFSTASAVDRNLSAGRTSGAEPHALETTAKMRSPVSSFDYLFSSSLRALHPHSHYVAWDRVICGAGCGSSGAGCGSWLAAMASGGQRRPLFPSDGGALPSPCYSCRLDRGWVCHCVSMGSAPEEGCDSCQCECRQGGVDGDGPFRTVFLFAAGAYDGDLC